MIEAALASLARDIGAASADLGRRVNVDVARVLDRSDSLALAPLGRVSPNGSCRLVEAADGWIAVNLARADDVRLLPVWLSATFEPQDWAAAAAIIAVNPAHVLLEQARLLSIPVARVGEVAAGALDPPAVRLREGGPVPARLHVLDLSALWAGPLCASILGELDADVLRLESAERPENTATPHYGRLNGGKTVETISWKTDQDRLAQEIARADVIVSSGRSRAFKQLSFDPFALLKPHTVWVAISGYGWSGENADRVAFGDDAAAAAGLVTWDESGPSFGGDALADPITGLAAAAAALRALRSGGGVLVDAALAYCAAGARR